MKAEMPIMWYDIIDSTNSEAKRRINDIDKMSVFAAKYQTAGRGQRGNKWSSASGENLMFSIALKFGQSGICRFKAADQFVLSEIATLAVHDFLTENNIVSKIKWPNDIYVRDKKICGILIENSLERDEISTSVIGIGINLKQQEFPPELLNPTSVFLLTGRKIEPESALVGFLEYFNNRLALISTEEGRARLEQDYLSVLYRKDGKYDYRDCTTGEIFKGLIKGISNGGKLTMKMPDDSIKEFTFKEISYII